MGTTARKVTHIPSGTAGSKENPLELCLGSIDLDSEKFPWVTHTVNEFKEATERFPAVFCDRDTVRNTSQNCDRPNLALWQQEFHGIRSEVDNVDIDARQKYKPFKRPTNVIQTV